VCGQAEAALCEGVGSGKKEQDMDKILTFALAMAVCLGTTAMLANSGRAARQHEKLDTQTATDGAFRDGLYVGRLAAEGGRPPHPQIGRWSNEHDRTSFVAGYRRGYNDFLASTMTGTHNRVE
jgi:hypothetical protein